ncbi:MAG TPA: A/G-specific adenine glycosylase, partial [Bacteroidetes bacterium]|nr:A/G-specific adenine glycosylase [Bacteroidota bacterium]
MNVTQTVDTEEIRRKLLAWYNEEKRDLPWRRISDPYAIWVSEVMLQQTQTVKVLDYFSRFIARFPTVTSLAAAESDEVLKMWEGLGYYARARNLHKAAQYIVEHLGGRIPDTRETLQKIPGIGAYTAAAVASIAFGEPCAVVDGNVIRVLSRLFAFAESPRSTGAKKFFQHKADELLAPDSPGDFNQALMELGATLCTPRKPGCLLCPLQKA